MVRSKVNVENDYQVGNEVTFGRSISRLTYIITEKTTKIITQAHTGIEFEIVFFQIEPDKEKYGINFDKKFNGTIPTEREKSIRCFGIPKGKKNKIVGTSKQVVIEKILEKHFFNKSR